MGSNLVKAGIIVLFIGIFGLLTFPALNGAMKSFDMSSQLPLTQAFFAAAPYGALVAFGYFAWRKTHK